MRKFVTIAITGGMGSGKNLVARKLSRLGCEIVDTDEIVHALYENNKALKRDIITLFGKQVLDDNGIISRNKLSEIVFKDTNNLKRLTDIVHPLVKKEVFALFDKLEMENYNGCVAVMVPQLVESGMQDDFDKVILVVADEDLRLNRCAKRSGLTVTQIKSRLQFQLPDEEKVKYADFVVDNNNSVEETEKQTEKIYYKIKQ